MLITKVLSYSSRHNLLRTGQMILVAVSGGPDSVCLLHVLMRLKSVFGFAIHVAHLNHGLRGTESAADADFVRQLAETHSLPYTIETRSAGEYRTAHRVSVEEAARIVRYDFLADVANRIGAASVAVGHTSDDQVETILLHFVRGTGLNGLRGMSPETELSIGPTGHAINVIRPLLEVSRAETGDYCEAHGLSPRLDSSNLSLSFTRNKLRLEVLPLLRTLNSGIDQTILRLSKTAARDSDFIDGAAAELLAQNAEFGNGVVSFEKVALLSASKNLLPHFFRLALNNLLGNLVDIEMINIDEIVRTLDKPAGTSINLPRNLVFMVGYNKYTLGFPDKIVLPHPKLTGNYPINIPGETLFPGWKVFAKLEDAKDGCVADSTPWMAHLDFAVTGKGLRVRSRVPGDRFRPLGMAPFKKLQDFLVDEKVPRDWRDSIPVLTNDDEIFWVVGLRIDDRAKITPKTTGVLHLEFEPHLEMAPE